MDWGKASRLRPSRSCAPVRVNPGHTAVTRTPLPRSSYASPSRRLLTNALLAAYTLEPGLGKKALPAETLMTFARPRHMRPSAPWPFVEPHFGLEQLAVALNELSVLRLTAGVVDEQIDRSLRVLDARHDARDAVGSGQVGRDDLSLHVMSLAKLLREACQPFGAARDEHDRRAIGRERSCERLADAGCGSRHEGPRPSCSRRGMGGGALRAAS
jgi:hypothetical protein